MKRKTLILVILLSLVFVFVGCEQKAEANEEQLVKFLNNLQGVEYEINNEMEYFEEYQKEDNQFAKNFYENFIKGKVEFIVPKYKTDNLNDSKLQGYLSKYPKFKFEVGQVIGDENDFMIVNKKYPHYNFKVYQIDFDNNNSNGLEDVFYSGGYWNDDEDGYSSYDILNKKNTDVINPYFATNFWIGGKLVEPEYESKDKKRTKDYTGIIKFEGRYYIYEVLDWDTMVIIDFYCWNKKLTRVSRILDYTIELEGN